MTDQNVYAIILTLDEDLPIIGIKVDVIDELVRLPQNVIHSIPRAKAMLQGIFVFREQTIPLLDLGQLVFNKPYNTRNAIKLPVLVIEIQNTKLSFLFQEVITYKNVRVQPELPLTMKLETNPYKQFLQGFTIEEQEGQQGIFIDIESIFQEFMEQDSTPSQAIKTEKSKNNEDDDFDLDQFTLKEGEKIDLEKFTLKEE